MAFANPIVQLMEMVEHAYFYATHLDQGKSIKTQGQREGVDLSVEVLLHWCYQYASAGP